MYVETQTLRSARRDGNVGKWHPPSVATYVLHQSAFLASMSTILTICFLTSLPEKDFCYTEGNLNGVVYSLLPQTKPHTWWKAELCVSGTPSLRKQLPSHISSGESGCQQLQSLFNKASIPARLRIMLKSKEQEEIIQSFFEFDHAKDTLLRLAVAFLLGEQLSFER